MIHVATVAASLLPAAAMAAEARFLTGRELEQAAARVRAAGAGASPAKLAGRRFRITIVPRQRGETNSICTGFPSWGWYPKEGTFELSHSGGSHEAGYFHDPTGALALPFAPKNLGEKQQWVDVHAFSCRYTREPRRRTENMYGEIVDHEPTREDVTAIAGRHTPSRGAAFRWDWLSVKTDEAGALVLGARMVVRLSGVLGEWSPGRSIVCGADDHSSLGVPVLTPAFSGCLINGRVERIEFVDAVTGKVRLSTTAKRRGQTGSGKDAGR
jgi:hypothetical protein